MRPAIGYSCSKHPSTQTQRLSGWFMTGTERMLLVLRKLRNYCLAFPTARSFVPSIRDLRFQK